MRALEAISTIDWIADQSKDFRKALDEFFEKVQRSPELAPASPELLGLVHRHGRLMDVLASNLSAVEVVTAFGLAEQLLKPNYLLSKAATAHPPQQMHLLVSGLWTELKNPFEDMLGFAKPLRELVVPLDLREGSIATQEILTINLTRETLDLAVVKRTLSDLESLYDAVNRISGNLAHSPLQILKIESGTSLSINLKGLGEPIKQLKELIIEVWTKHRQKRVDEILDHHRVMASGIRLIDEIDKSVRKKSLTPEDGARFKRSLLKDTFSLFGNGALIDEIPAIEKVNNVALLGAFGPKLLSAPEGGDGAKATYAPIEEATEVLPETLMHAPSLPKTSAASKKKIAAKKKSK